MTPRGPLGSFRERADSPLSQGVNDPQPTGVGPPSLPPLPPQRLPRFHPAPRSVLKHAGNINLSPAIHLCCCWLREQS